LSCANISSKKEKPVDETLVDFSIQFKGSNNLELNLPCHAEERCGWLIITKSLPKGSLKGF